MKFQSSNGTRDSNTNGPFNEAKVENGTDQGLCQICLNHWMFVDDILDIQHCNKATKVMNTFTTDEINKRKLI